MGGILGSFEDSEIRSLRQSVMNRFKGQNFLLLGQPGVGKSSIVNSFNYVINLHELPNSPYVEVATVGSGEIQQTVRLQKYDGRGKGRMYSELDLDGRQSAPGFIDLIGLPNREFLSDLIQHFVDGKIPHNTALKKALDADDATERQNLIDDNPDIQRDLVAWTILFVVSAASSEFPENLASDVLDAVSRVNEAEGDEQRRADVRIYVIVTKLDKVQPARERQQRLKEMTSMAARHLNVNSDRVFDISNFTSTNDCKNGKWNPDNEKQLKILKAFSVMLVPAHSAEPFA
eukprot:m.308751 g.308751  ORF g.308751 m.308751 type:complete len:289 (+) comp44679_c0_seq1:107-973(+)